MLSQSARGSLAKYANTALWEEEGTAWEKAVGEKNDTVDFAEEYFKIGGAVHLSSRFARNVTEDNDL